LSAYLETTAEKTLVLYGPENALKVVKSFYSRVQNVSNLITDTNGPQAIIEVEDYRQILKSLIDRGIKRRLITEITKENLVYCKQLSALVELRHLEGVKGNFAVSETEYMATAILHKTEPVTQVIYSNATAVVEQHNYLFDTLWSKAISAQQKILEIEEGVETDFFKVITDVEEAARLLISLARGAKNEVLFVLPNDRAVIRMERMGVLEILKQKSEAKVKVKVICPISDSNLHIIERLRKESEIAFTSSKEIQSGLLIIDSSQFLSAELVRPDSEDFKQAIGTTLYSNSKRTVNLLRSFFDSLWNQVELYKRLELQERLEKEFVNIAAHELRTPVQPILGMTEILMRLMVDGGNDAKDARDANDGKDNSDNIDKETIQVTREDLAIIRRNAIRLDQLTSDILDIARIESGLLHLQKETCMLDDIITQAIRDIEDRLTIFDGKSTARKLTIDYHPSGLIVNADKVRIAEVLYNLIDNSVKFTKNTDGANNEQITISAEEKNGEIIVTTKDTGPGIDSEMIPRLFSKFASKSDRGGTGLGLFIARSIVEAHGGRIWGENNSDGRGACFSFALPIDK